MIVKENKTVINYLTNKNLVKPYLKAKRNILNNNFYAVSLKKRQQKSDNLYYFRINKQYRALAQKVNNELLVFCISDHQN